MISFLLGLQLAAAVAPDTVTVGEHFIVTVRDSSGKSANYELAAWDTGSLKIQPNGAVALVKGDSTGVPVTSASVYVRSVLPKDTTLRVPKPLRPGIVIRPFDWLPWIYAAIAIAVIALLYWLWHYLRNRARQPVDPYKAAKQKFAKIERMRLLDGGHTRRYVTLMIEVVRRYLCDRIPDASLSHTTEELLGAVKAGETPLARDLKALLEGGDRAKFGPANVTINEAELIGRESVRVVDEAERWTHAAREAVREAKKAGAAAA